jgi:hypothetical protein
VISPGAFGALGSELVPKLLGASDGLTAGGLCTSSKAIFDA